MTLFSVAFYILASVIIISTGIAITRRNLVHAAVYLIISFFGSAMLFYLLGAPLLAALEVIIYAGAIMVLFLFIIMMLDEEKLEEKFFPIHQWTPAAVMSGLFVAVAALIISGDSDSQVQLQAFTAEPASFGRYLFQKHWLAIEIVSLLLLIALIGVLYLGRDVRKNNPK
ncbi:MAG: NADH-quinone oxidoreductase subunit J [Desulfobacterales bacterium]|nr:MAG: NADH-quinone oxidoreductase subunit J [Desulfobacterales bacterium]